MSHGTPPPNDPPSEPFGQPPTPPPGNRATAKGFFGALFDFTFEHFVTPMIVKVVYVLAIIALGVGFLVFLAVAFAEDAASGLFVLILGPIGVLLYLCLIRMTLEFYLAITRMSQDIHQRLR